MPAPERRHDGPRASDDDFEAWLSHIDATRSDADVDELMAMGTALMGMGKRSARLWPEAVRLARAISPIGWDPTGACEPFDVVKHLDNDRLSGSVTLRDWRRKK